MSRAMTRWAWLALVMAITAACSPAATLPPPVPIADRQIAVIEVVQAPDWLAAGFGSVWVKRGYGDVVRIDASSHEVIATIETEEPFANCSGIGSDGTSIWACSGSDIVRIDPTTNAIVARVPARKVWVQGQLVWLAGRIWILTGEDADQLVGVDTETLEIGPPIDLGENCADLAAGADALWVVCTPGGHVLRIDPASGTVSDPIAVAEASQASVGADAVWVIGSEGVVRIDLDDHSTRVIETGLLAGPFPTIWASDDAVWVHGDAPNLTVIDPSTQRVVERIEAEWTEGGDIVGVDGTIWTSESKGSVVVHLRGDPP